MEKGFYKINKESCAIDIFRDNDFLRLFRIFILKYVKDNLEDKNIVKLYNQFNDKNFLENFKNKNTYNLFLQFEAFFKESINLTSFLEFLKNYDIDKKLLNVFLEVADFLENVSFNKGEYPKEFYSISNDYKIKIVDIVWKRDLENIKFILLQEWYPLFSPFWYEIINAEFWEGIDYININFEEDRFIKCIDSQNNIFYQNKFWEILKDKEWKRIINVKLDTIKNFWDFRIYWFINEDWEDKIQIEPEKKLWFDSKYNISWNFFSVKEISFTEKILDKDKKVLEKKEVFPFLVIHNIDKENNKVDIEVLNESLEEITIVDLLLFLNKNDFSFKKDLMNIITGLKVDFDNIDIKDIEKIYDFNWIKFIKIFAEINYQNKSWKEYTENNHIIISENWKILFDNHEFGQVYISSLLWKNKFLWKEFVSFSLTNTEFIDWYIDSFWKIVKVKGETLLSIEKMPFTMKKEELLIELDLFDSFNLSETKIEFFIGDWKYIKIWNSDYEKVIINLWENNTLRAYLQNWLKRTFIEYEKLENKLKNTETWKKILSQLEKILNHFQKLKN